MPTRPRPRRRTRLHCSPRVPRSRRRAIRRSRSSARPATTHRRATRWASACSTTSPSRRAPRKRKAPSALRSSTSTSTTETGRRTSSGTTTPCFFVSLHQWPFYPGTGGPQEQRETTLNVPMSAGSGDEQYLRAFDHSVAPAVERFEPELVIVSAGFDAHEADPLAGMNVTEAGFRELATRCRSLAPAYGRRARRRLQPRDAARTRRRSARRLRVKRRPARVSRPSAPSSLCHRLR